VAITRLEAAGLYSGNLMAVQASKVPVKINGGVANLPGHKSVICSRCHDMEATPCSACHQPKLNDHANRGTDCNKCHTTSGAGFAFSHPAATSSCGGCHPLPAKHFQPSSGAMPACTTCHAEVAVSWAFAHPNAITNCVACHTPPVNHATGQCSNCHAGTSAFTFNHPSVREHNVTSFACANCHPNGYTSYSCTCHGGGNAGGEGGAGVGSAEGGEHGDRDGGDSDDD
jgi:hypothetical protein